MRELYVEVWIGILDYGDEGLDGVRKTCFYGLLSVKMAKNKARQRENVTMTSLRTYNFSSIFALILSAKTS